MQISQSRRDFLASASLAAAAGVLGARASLADEGPPETTTIRLQRGFTICLAPRQIAEELLRAEGFTDIRYVDAGTSPDGRGAISRFTTAASSSPAGCGRSDHGGGGRAFRVLRAVRARADPGIRDLKGKTGRHPGASARAAHLLLASMAAHVGLDHERHRLGQQRDRRLPGAVRRRQGRRFSRLPARAAGAARPQDRPRDPQHGHGHAVVAVLLLHGLRQP